MNSSDVARALQDDTEQIALALTDLHYRRVPELVARYGAVGREKCLQDGRYHLSYLSQAVSVGDEGIFVGYVGWGRSVLVERGIPVDDLVTNMECLLEVLEAHLEPEAIPLVTGPIRAALASLDLPDDPYAASLLEDGAPHVGLARTYLAQVLAGQRRDASRLILQASDDGVSIRDLYLHVFTPVQREVGRLWQRDEITVAQEHFCTAVTQLVMSQLYPKLFTGRRLDRRLVATCVSGDLHEIGVRMVADFFEMEGWDTFYLGANTPPDSVLDSAISHRAQVVAISATIAGHIPQVRTLVDAVRAESRLEDAVVLVGGYPFNQSPDLWREVGADGTASDPGEAIALVEGLLQGRTTDG